MIVVAVGADGTLKLTTVSRNVEQFANILITNTDFQAAARNCWSASNEADKVRAQQCNIADGRDFVRSSLRTFKPVRALIVSRGNDHPIPSPPLLSPFLHLSDQELFLAVARQMTRNHQIGHATRLNTRRRSHNTVGQISKLLPRTSYQKTRRYHRLSLA